MTLRRMLMPLMSGLLMLAAAIILWSFAYAAITALAFRDLGLLRTVTEHDPTASWTHLTYYWSDPRVPRHGALALLATLLVLGGLIASVVLIRPPSTFGDARFAKAGDITRANLHADGGLILGRRGGLLIRHDEPGHVLVEGPTRSGKGQGFVEPNGLTWEGSLICLDPKQENLKAFGAARLARGDAVFLFAPGAVRSHAWNPLDLVRRGPEMATDCANLAAFLIPEPRGEGAFWASSARNLFAATLGYVLETPLCDGRRHLGSALALFSTGQDVAAALEIVDKTERARLSPFIVDQFNQFAAMPEKTRGSVVAHLIDALKPWNNPLIVAATARSDFNLRQLRERRMSIFIGAPVADLENCRPLVRVLIQQVHDQLMRELPETDDAQPVLLLLDEFPTLGRMEALVAKLPVSAGYGIRMAIIVQALSQLDEIYGRPIRDTILANTDLKLFVGTNDQATAAYISEALGTRTAIAKTLSGARSQNPFTPRTATRVEVAAPLMRPEQVRELDRKKAILLVRGERPILLDKIVAHGDRWFAKLKRSGNDALLSVPQLKPTRDASPFLGLQRPAALTPREFGTRRHDLRQHDLPLEDHRPTLSDHGSPPPEARQRIEALGEQLGSETSGPSPPISLVSEAEPITETAFRAFIAQASTEATPERLAKLQESADRFLVLSRKFAGDRAELEATRRDLTVAG